MGGSRGSQSSHANNICRKLSSTPVKIFHTAAVLSHCLDSFDSSGLILTNSLRVVFSNLQSIRNDNNVFLKWMLLDHEGSNLLEFYRVSIAFIYTNWQCQFTRLFSLRFRVTIWSPRKTFHFIFLFCSKSSLQN